MDYCTLWLEGWWQHCCAIHDAGYLAQIVRALADAELFRCVAESAPVPILEPIAYLVAFIMYIGVRAFGRRFYRKQA